MRGFETSFFALTLWCRTEAYQFYFRDRRQVGLPAVRCQPCDNMQSDDHQASDNKASRGVGKASGQNLPEGAPYTGAFLTV